MISKTDPKFYISQEKAALEEQINIAKLAVFNAVGSQSINYFRNLDRILNQLPCTIMGMTWHQVLYLLNTTSYSISAVLIIEMVHP